MAKSKKVKPYVAPVWHAEDYFSHVEALKVYHGLKQDGMPVDSRNLLPEVNLTTDPA